MIWQFWPCIFKPGPLYAGENPRKFQFCEKIRNPGKFSIQQRHFGKLLVGIRKSLRKVIKKRHEKKKSKRVLAEILECRSRFRSKSFRKFCNNPNSGYSK